MKCLCIIVHHGAIEIGFINTSYLLLSYNGEMILIPSFKIWQWKHHITNRLRNNWRDWREHSLRVKQHHFLCYSYNDRSQYFGLSLSFNVLYFSAYMHYPKVGLHIPQKCLFCKCTFWTGLVTCWDVLIICCFCRDYHVSPTDDIFIPIRQTAALRHRMPIPTAAVENCLIQPREKSLYIKGKN